MALQSSQGPDEGQRRGQRAAGCARPCPSRYRPLFESSNRRCRRRHTRFAPSPTGFLHIGGARTALFNWLAARSQGGAFLLRIEDTDRARSTPEAIDAILDGLGWLGLDWDGEAIFQSQRADRHREVAESLLAAGKAYRCYATPDELREMRETAKAEGRPPGYDGRWRDRDPSEAPDGVAPTIRFKAPREGEQVIEDLVQGSVTVANRQLDDMVILRGDGSPTYMLSVVVDDHDMGVTQVIRGDDHLTNAFRQRQLFEAMDWPVPSFGHIPLIHGPDGAKLSKRHGALGIEAYRDMGYLPAALRNYLLRLGWGHGDDEIISDAQARDWFKIGDVGKNPARFDFAKLDSLNAHYLRSDEPADLVARLEERHCAAGGAAFTEDQRDRLLAGMPGLTPRAKRLDDLLTSAAVYLNEPPLTYSADALKLLTPEAIALLSGLEPLLHASGWDREELESSVRSFAEEISDPPLKLGKVAQPLRAAITGSKVSPPIFEVMEILGRESCLSRLQDALTIAGK
ncbi:MAG: glutamate--tRNA ligase [Pseudomonadota bacterium]